jgi:REP element-mobilizing transposase RayT
MSNLDYKPEYRKNLPHVQPPGATLFVTGRLAGSLPRPVVAALKAEAEQVERAILATAPAAKQGRLLYRAQRQAFGRLDALLDAAETGPTWLKRAEIANMVMESVHFLNGSCYDLDVFCIMSNHMHLVFTPLLDDDGQYVALSRIMHSLKRHTAGEANGILGREGQFWQHESYDHVVRDEQELDRIRRYVLYNPVRAGLVDDPQDWPYSWAKWWDDAEERAAQRK